MAVTAVIPSRFGSTRFPGKPLALINGLPMIQHVYERCREAGCFARVVVATDDERIEAAARAFGAAVLRTATTHQSGTDRVAEVARVLGLGAKEIVVNVQGDEPALHPTSLRTLTRLFDDPTVELATLVRPLAEEERSRPTVVKAVLDEQWRALYFSRADLPFERETLPTPIRRWAHVGLYGYRAEVLLRLASLPPTLLERTESLEQLRALGHGLRITCAETTHASVAVDVPDDVPRAEAAVRALLGSRT